MVFGTYQIHIPLVYNSVLYALKCGYRIIDTAVLYKNHQQIGQALQYAIENKIISSRKDVIIITKVHNKDQKLGQDAIFSSIDIACKELNLDYIDIVLLHSFIEKDTTIAAYKTLEKLMKMGKCLNIGVSNFNVDQLKIILNECQSFPILNQIETSPFCILSQVRTFCKKNNILLQAHSPLTKCKLLNDTQLQTTCKELYLSPVEILLQWSLYMNDSVIVRSINEEHIQENVNILKSTNAHNNTQHREKLLRLCQQHITCHFQTHSQYKYI